MSVAAASGAVSTQQHQPTQEQIRLAQLIEDKKHDQPEVQEILRKVLDVVANSNQDDVLVALFDCDYDFEKTVALLIEKGHEVASEWRTATNHKTNKKQLQKVAVTKNGHGELNENVEQRGNEGPTSRGKSRAGRGRVAQSRSDSQSATNQQQKQNENYNPQQRQRGGTRGRYRGNYRGGHRGIDRNYHYVQDANIDSSLPSDTNRRSRGGGANSIAVAAIASSQQQELFDVGNWDGKTLIYSRSIKNDEQLVHPTESSEVASNNQSNINTQDKSKSNFDLIEAARQIKNVIGIGQTPKPSVSDHVQKSKPAGQPVNTKLTPPPPSAALRIPQQPVVFSDRFDGGVQKIDVQFGNLSEPFDEAAATASSATAYYHQSSHSISANKVSQRTTEQSSHISPSPRSTEQPVMNQQQPQQQRLLPTQIQQQQTMPLKPIVTPQYTVHQQQHPINAQNMLLQSLLFHAPPAEPVALDTSYDPTTFSLAPIDLTTPYYMSATINQPVQQQTQPRYAVSQQPQLPQQSSSKSLSTSSVSTSTSTSTTTAKKGPAVPPGMFPPVQALNTAAYSTTYGVQQQATGANFSTPYDAEHLFPNTFMSLTNTQQAQSPSGAYGSVTPPVQQQTQQSNNNNDNKTLNYTQPFAENLMLLQQYQQFTLQQSNSQQQGQQSATHSPAQLNYFLSHGPTPPSYSGPPIMYAQAATAMPQHQQPPKQQGQQYNQNNSSAGIGVNDAYYNRGSSASNKERPYIYAASNQPQHLPPQSTGQQQNVNKQQQQQQRTSGNAYNNQQGQQRSFH